VNDQPPPIAQVIEKIDLGIRQIVFNRPLSQVLQAGIEYLVKLESNVRSNLSYATANGGNGTSLRFTDGRINIPKKRGGNDFREMHFPISH
jgi:hypothetical protein